MIKYRSTVFILKTRIGENVSIFHKEENKIFSPDRASVRSFTLRPAAVKEDSRKGDRVSSSCGHVLTGAFLAALCVVLLLCCAKILIGSFGFFGSVPAGIYDCELTPAQLRSFWLAAFAWCAVTAASYALPKHSGKVSVGVFAVAAVYFGYHYKEVANGAIHAVNQAIFTLSRAQGGSATIYYLTNYTVEDPPQELKTFLLAVIACTAFIAAYAVIRRCSPLMTVCIVAMYSVLPLVTYAFSEEVCFVAAIAVCIVVLVCRVCGYSSSYDKVKVSRFTHTVRVRGKRTAWAALQQGAAAVLCLAVILTTIAIAYNTEGYTRSEDLDELADDISDMVQRIGSGGGFGTSTSNSLDNGNLYSSGNIKYTGETMFRLSQDWGSTSAIYLRSFTAAQYSTKRWSAITKSVYRRYTDMWDLFGENSFLPQFMYGTYSNISSQYSAVVNTTIVNVNINSRTFLTSANMLSERTESLSLASAVYDNAFTANEKLSSYTQSIVKPLYYMENTAGVLNEEPADTLYDTLYYGDFYYRDLWEVEDTFSEYSYSSEEYLSMEKQYRQFVMENYTDCPDNIAALLPESIDPQAVYDEYSVDHSSLYGNTYYYYDDGSVYIDWDGDPNYDVVTDYYEVIIEAVRSYLQATCSYTLSPGSTPYGEDFTEYFLTENNKGYCVHFATAACLLLRAAGIPTRYVEGYYISADDLLHTDSNGYISVPDSRAHAWTEVYYPLTGWQVVDFTPSYSEGSIPAENDEWLGDTSTDSQADTDTSADIYTDTDTAADTSTDTDTAVDTDTSPDTDTLSGNTSSIASSSTDTTSRFWAAAVGVLETVGIALAIAAGAAVLYLLIRLCVTSARKRRFNSSDRRKAAKALYKHSLHLLRLAGVSEKDMSDSTYSKSTAGTSTDSVEFKFDEVSHIGEIAFAKYAESKCELIQEGSYVEFTRTVLKGRFGRLPPSKDEIAQMNAFARELAGKIYDSKGKLGRIAMKYVLFYV